MKKRYLIPFASVLALSITSCDKANDPAANTENPTPTDGKVLFEGSFEGRNDHVVTGGVQIVESGGEISVVLADNFSLDGAPAPKVGLGRDGYKKDTQSGALKSKTGASSYTLKKGIDPEGYNEVYIWCEKFDVALGVAKLSPSE